MSLDKYQQAWNVESLQSRIEFDAEVLSKEVQQSHEAFGSMIFWRDVREIGTSLLMVPTWCVMGIGMSLPSNPGSLTVRDAVDRRLHGGRSSTLSSTLQ